MGKGDKRSRKGKIWRGSYGNTRRKKDVSKPAYVAKPKVKKAPAVPVEETLFELPVVEGTETKAAKPKKAAAPKKPKAEKAEGEKKAPAKPKKKAAPEAEAESATEEKAAE